MTGKSQRSVRARRGHQRNTLSRAAAAAIEHLEGRVLLSTIYQATMDANPGWTASGQWAYGIPTGQGGTANGYHDPIAGYTGSNVYGVNLNGDYSTTPGGPYYLTTQAINCSGYTGVQLQYRRWLNSDYGPYVVATVAVSNNGTTWTNLYTNSTSADVQENAWSLQTHNISAVADNQATVYIRWGYQVSTGAFAYSGWNLDDVVVSGTSGGTSNPSPITIPSVGSASPYPSTITLSGLSGVITDVNVTLKGVTHSWPDDMDILLVGPGGQKVMLMSDVGGNAALAGINLTLDDEAAAAMPDSTQISAGTYRPTDMETGETMNAPAPAGPYSALLSALDGTSPNGTWSLYVLDDTSGDSGSITGGWELAITTGTSVLGELHGVEWNDLDGDGAREAGEPGLANWRVYLDANLNGQWDTGESSVLTDASGNYAFTGLAAGSYTVAQVLQAGWTRTCPTGAIQSSVSGPSTIGTVEQLLSGEVQAYQQNSGPSAPVSTESSVITWFPQTAFSLSDVPTSTWTYGCSATSAGMIFGYYDRHGYANMYSGPANGGVAPLTNLGQGDDPLHPIAGASSLIATQNGFDGRATPGHVDDYWIANNSAGPDPWQATGTEHTWGGCVADFMGTNQWKWDFNSDGTTESNIDGATTFFSAGATKLYDYIPPASAGLPTTELCHGMRLFAESRGYTVLENYTQAINERYAGGFTFADYQAEINGGHPVMIQLSGHSVVGVGYDASTSTVYLHDTWDNAVHSMTWGGSYAGMNQLAVTVIHLASVAQPGTYTVTLAAGQVVNNLDFGNLQNLPNVTLSLSGSPMIEAGGTATVTATLSEASTSTVTVNLGFSGTATSGSDYSRSAAQITIAPGNLSGTITLTALQDTILEPDETIIVDITSVTNANESGTQQVTATIKDDDAAPGTISGTLWRDVDGDGVKDSGDGVLAGWEVYLDANVNGQWDAGEGKTTTNGSGVYTFANLTPGIYVVSETVPAGWGRTFPGSDGQITTSAAGTGGAEVSATSLAPRVGRISINSNPEGDAPREIAFTRDGNYVLVVNRDTDNVTVFNAATRAVVANINVGDNPTDVAVGTSYAVVTNLNSNSVSIISLSTWTVVGTVPITGTQPHSVEVTADGTKAVVGVINMPSSGVPSRFSIIDLNTRTEVRSFATTPQSWVSMWISSETGDSGSIYTRFAVSPDNQTIVLTDKENARVTLYNLNTGVTLATLATAASPSAVDISSDGTRAVISHQGSTRKVSVIALAGASSSVIGSWSVGADLDNYVIRITPDKNYAIATTYNDVLFVNLATGATATDIYCGTIFDLEVSYDGQYVFVPGYDPDLINIPSRTLTKTYFGLFAHETAISPTTLRAVSLNRDTEQVEFFNLNGASGYLEGALPAGSSPEGDAPRYLAVSPDGKTAITGNTVSGNISILNLETGTVRAYVSTGGRVQGVAISPDGRTAVVANMDSDTLSVIDLTTDTLVKTLVVPTRPDQVVISPDSQWAYVDSVYGTDKIYFIQLAGAASTVVSSLATGNYGSVGYAYAGSSGLTLSPDGSILAACSSYTSELILINTSTRSVIAAVNTGANSMPRRAAFSPSGTRIYVANYNTNTVSVIQVNGAASSVIATIAGMDSPATVNVDATGAFVYVGNNGYTTPGLKVIDAATNTVVGSITLPGNGAPNSSYFSAADSMLYLVGADSSGYPSVFRVRAQGASSTLVDATALGAGAMTLGFSESLKTAVVTLPVADAVAVVDYSPRLPGSHTVKLDAGETVSTADFGNLPPLDAPVVNAEPAYTAGTANTISWNSISGATEYYLEWDTTNAFATPDGNSGWISGTSATATGLVNGVMYYFHVKARNATQQSDWSNTVNSTQDATPPSAPAITGIASDTGISASDGITSDNTLLLSGTAEPLATVQVFRNGMVIGSTTANSSGAWTFDYTGTTLGDGIYSFTATATDAAGNPSSASSPFAVTIDTAAPTIVSLDNSSVAENLASGATVGHFSSADSTVGDSFTYTLVSGTGSDDNASFVIAGNELRTAASFNYELKNSYAIRVRSTDRAGLWMEKAFTIGISNLREASIAGRWLFYNTSYFDGNNPAATSADDGAIATDKQALLPGQTASFANYSSYSRGLNGLMLDLAGFAGTLSAANFVFKVGNSATPASWAAAPAPSSISQRALAGGNTRVTLLWADNAIQKQWLQVRVLASDASDLAGDDLFYFGNAIGESGDTPVNAIVNATDELGARNNARGVLTPAPITFRWDYNRDHLVNATDQLIARSNTTGALTALRLFAAPITTTSAGVFASAPLRTTATVGGVILSGYAEKPIWG